VFYQICEEDRLAKILEIIIIEKAHKLYKRCEGGGAHVGEKGIR
jgi:hypothetical protein